MSHVNKDRLPARLDPQVMADHHGQLIGSIPVKPMMRLQNITISMQPMIAVTLQFARGLYGLPMVTGQIKHNLGLRCERCLDEINVSLEQPVEVVIKPKSEVLKNTEVHDFYEYNGKNIELADLIEEELLLALPVAPKHKDISLCNQDMIAWLALSEAPTENMGNPFAILKR